MCTAGASCSRSLPKRCCLRKPQAPTRCEGFNMERRCFKRDSGAKSRAVCADLLNDPPHSPGEVPSTMRPMPLDGQMMRLKRLAQDREEKLGYQANVDSADPAGEEEAGAAVDEHSDTWAFSWMPAIEDFMDQAARRADAAREDSGSSDEEGGPPGKKKSRGGDRTSRTGRLGDGNGDPISSGDEADPVRSGRKRRRTRTREGAWSRRALHPPSYNETLLADKAFHNPHASETMAGAFGVFRPASFLLDVGADDRPWGGAAAAAAAEKHVGKGGEAARAEAGNREKEDARGGEGSGTGDRSWFYDTVRDRQNRLWADTRVQKGVELARKGQHQAAIDIYTQALGMCPGHGDGLVARGAAFATTGRLRQAMQDLSRAVSLDPHNDNASSYLKETRRRIERQESRELPNAATVGAGLTGRGVSRLDQTEYGERMEADVVSAGSAAMLRGSEDNEASKSALRALLQDGAEGDALRKMRALLEEDERKRKRERRSSGRGEGRGDAEEGGGGKKKSRKKEKKSKSKRRSSSRHKRDRDRGKEQRQSTGGGGGDSRFDSGSSSSSSSDSEEVGSRSKKKKKRRKHKKRSRARSMSPSISAIAGSRNGGGLRGTLALSSAMYSAVAADSEGDDPHPILQRKKHSLWG